MLKIGIFDELAVVLSALNGMETICLEHELQSNFKTDSLQMIIPLMMFKESFQIILNESDRNPFETGNVLCVFDSAEKYVGGDSNEETEKEDRASTC